MVEIRQIHVGRFSKEKDPKNESITGQTKEIAHPNKTIKLEKLSINGTC